MTENGFFHAMLVIKRVYGEEAYPPERQRVILSRLKRLTDEEFETVCETVIGENRYAPTLKEFEKAAKGFLDAAIKREEAAWNQTLKERRQQNLECRRCDDTGYVSAIDKENRLATSFAFKCPAPGCMVAEKYARVPIPKWSQAWEGRFILVSDNLTPHQVWVRHFGEPNPDYSSKDPATLNFDGLMHVSQIGAMPKRRE